MQEIQESLKLYFKDWNEWVSGADEYDFAALNPMHAGWKVADEAALGQQMAAWLPYVKGGHIGTVDSRKIALLVVKEPVERVPVLQVMQLRPGSKDPLGLDHVAFFCADMTDLQTALQKRSEKWEHQSNPGHSWISMWFGPNAREVKFFDHTSLDLGARELTEDSDKIKNA